MLDKSNNLKKPSGPVHPNNPTLCHRHTLLADLDVTHTTKVLQAPNAISKQTQTKKKHRRGRLARHAITSFQPRAEGVGRVV
jgi:hypothetical protein